MKRIRLSYSMLSAAKRGDFETVRNMFLRKEMPRTQEQIDGLEYHKRWEDTINKIKAVKIGLGEYIFNTPKCEQKLEVDYGDDFTLVGVLDVLDGSRIYEFKTGTQDVFSYAASYQLPIYFLLAKLKGIEVNEGWIIHYNQYEERGEMAVVRNSPLAIDEASNYVDTLGGMVKSYLQNLKLI